MENGSDLLGSFGELNTFKRWNPGRITQDDLDRWMEMRREIEKVLFNVTIDPAKDSRMFLRVPVNLKLRYWTQIKQKVTERYISVLGEGGLFIYTRDLLPVGSPLLLEFVLDRRAPSLEVIKAEVVWINKGADQAHPGMGVKFVDMTYENKRVVYGLVDDILQQYQEAFKSESSHP
jgi:uncharacterized protein (TIGR02266 family)